MRIVIDLQCCQSGSSLGGIGRYSLELAKAMVSGSPGDEFIIILNNRNQAGAAQVRREFKNILPQSAIRIFDIPAGCTYFHKDPIAVAAAEAIRETFIESLEPDAVHLTSHFEGLGDEVVTSIPKSGPPVAVTLYDLIPYLQQKTYLTDKTAKAHYLTKFGQLQNAKALLAISQFSADEGREHIANATQHIVNIRGGVDEKFRRVSDAAALDGVLARLGTGPKFLLYTASFDQRKNQERLVRAFAAVPADVRHGTKLVMVGNGWQGIYNDLKRVGSSLGVPEDDIVFTGRVADDELVALYNRAYLFVFPPLWEGLGLPPLEAMACGAPAIGSNTTSIPEVIGLAEAMFDPTNVDAISALITKALSDEAFIGRLRTHGRQHSSAFTWEASAKIALDAIREMVANERNAKTGVATRSTAVATVTAALSALPAPSPDRIKEIAYCLAANELEISSDLPGMGKRKQGWITTWGTRCGIATYSQNLIEHLTDEVHIFAPHVDVDLPAEEANTDRCWSVGGGDLTDLKRCLALCGITDIMIQFNYGFFDFAELNRFVEDEIRQKRRVYFTLHSTIDPAGGDRKLADLLPAFSASSGIFVHSDGDVERLAKLGVAGNVVQINHFVYPAARVEAHPGVKARQRIGSYGFFLPGKGLIELIEAVALLVASGRDIELNMVNADYGDTGGVSRDLIAQAARRVQELDLTGRITMNTGFLSNAESLAHLQTADLIVFPYQRTGESASGAVKMGLASGRPVAVTPLAIFDDVCHATHVLPGMTPAELARGMAAALDLIAAEAPAARKIDAAAAAWCASNDVRHVARYLERIIVQRSASEAWEVFAEPALATLPLGSAKLERGCITSTAAPSVLVHGPYLTLPPGVYRVIVNGAAAGPANEPAGTLKLTTDCGRTDLKVVHIASGEGTIADTTLSLGHTVTDFEVAPLVAAHSSLSVSGYQILRRRFR